MSRNCRDRPRHALGYWASQPNGLGFLYQRFSLLGRNEACQFRNQKAERWLSGNHGSLGDSWPIAFSGYPRGPRVGCETTCPRHSRLTYQLRLALEPECLENPTATAREDPQDGADSVRDTQTVCGFRYWASKHTPFFHTIKTIVAIFLAKVSRAISGRMPLASNAA